MPRACSVCVHPDRENIDAALAAGEAFRAIAQRTGTSVGCLHRHRQNHMGDPAADSGSTEETMQTEAQATRPDTFREIERTKVKIEQLASQYVELGTPESKAALDTATAELVTLNAILKAEAEKSEREAIAYDAIKADRKARQQAERRAALEAERAELTKTIGDQAMIDFVDTELLPRLIEAIDMIRDVDRRAVEWNEEHQRRATRVNQICAELGERSTYSFGGLQRGRWHAREMLVRHVQANSRDYHDAWAFSEWTITEKDHS